MLRKMLVGVVALVAVPVPALSQLQVVSTAPALNAFAPVGTSVSIEFDRPLDTATVTADSFRVFGMWSGAVQGTFAFSNGDSTVTLTPNRSFSAGEMVFVNLSHDLEGADASTLRAEGYAFQFMTAVTPSSATFDEIDTFSNSTGAQTRIYGASAADLNRDGYPDLATINEVSADVRVFLNRADGSGLFHPMLAPQPIGVEASPNSPADFDNDGFVDLCIGAAISDSVWILLGAGDGTFSSAQEVEIGGEPHGVVPIDADGDGDLDIVSANVGSNNLSLLVNDGSGNFAAPIFFEGGVNGEYGLAAADMDGDGITDLVVAGRNGEQVVTMLGNGNGTFTAAGSAQSSGGSTWVVVLGDVNGDGDLDAATANDGSGNVGVLLGQGDGTFAPVTTIPIGSHVPSTDLGDLDGDGDLDMVVSSFGGGFWRWFRNDGSGSFAAVESFPAPDNPSCAVLLDFDSDGDLDLALTDEIADVIVLMENGGLPACSTVPSDCRAPILEGKSKLLLKDKGEDGDILSWIFKKGEATTKAEFGDPLTTDGYALCLYEDGELVRELSVPAGQTCGNKPCWKSINPGYSYGDKEGSPDGVSKVKLLQGLVDGATRIKVKGKGSELELPDLSEIAGVLDVQLQKTTDSLCWGATFTPPFKKQDATILKASSDPSSMSNAPAPIWSAIQAEVIGPVCGSCHGGVAGLSDLHDCDAGYANLVGVASTELPLMNRVEPGDPTMSWLMHKLDGTQGDFTAQCTGMFCGSQMPLGGPFFDADVRDAIRTWITNGALNDCP